MGELYSQALPGWRSTQWASVVPHGVGSGQAIYLFGVFGGNSMIEWSRIIRECDLRIDQIVAFDSFQGVPKEYAEPVKHDVWDPDLSTFYSAFNASEYFGVSDPKVAADMAIQRARPHFKGLDVEFVPIVGFYEDSLVESPRDMGLLPPAVVEIDVDIYSSTVTVLDWLEKHDAMIPDVTQIGYDDWDDPGGFPSFGEGRANGEWVASTGTKLRTLFDNSNQRVFLYGGRR